MKKNKNKKELVLFFNGKRGFEVFKYLKRQKYLIKEIYVSKKFLNRDTVYKLDKNKTKYKIINNLDKVNFSNFKNSIGIVCGFPYIFNQKQIKNFYKIINCHAGKLPNYRGGSPLSWQMINGEKFFGITVLYLTSKIDQGNILAEKKFQIKKNFSIKNLHFIANKNFPKMVNFSIKKILRNNKGLKQSKKTANYYHQRSSKDSKISFKNMEFSQISRYVKALQGDYPKAFFFYKGKKISISSIKNSNIKLNPGEVKKKKNCYHIGCKDGSILIRQSSKL